MVDEEIHNASAGPAGAPPNRDAQPDPVVIEGEITARGPDEREPPPGAPEGENAPQPEPEPAPPPEPRRVGSRGVLAGAVAGLVVSALALAAGYALLASKSDVADNANRLAAIEAQAQQENAALETEAKRESAALASLDKRVNTLEAGSGASGVADLDKRVAALEAAKGDNAPNAATTAQADQQFATQVKDLQAGVDAARGAIPGLAARVAKLETETPKANADLSALAARLDKVEAALAAPKSEARVAADNAAAIAIIAEAAENRLRAGAPLGSELVALQHLGVDPAAMAPLQAVVKGAPTNGALAASFTAVAQHVLAATSPKEEGSVTDRFLAHIHNLVRVRDLSETAGDDPQALISQIEAESQRGDIGGALAAFDKLPEAARQAAGDWPAQARARQAADAALQSIREAAIGRLAGGSSP